MVFGTAILQPDITNNINTYRINVAKTILYIIYQSMLNIINVLCIFLLCFFTYKVDEYYINNIEHDKEGIALMIVIFYTIFVLTIIYKFLCYMSKKIKILLFNIYFAKYKSTYMKYNSTTYCVHKDCHYINKHYHKKNTGDINQLSDNEFYCYFCDNKLNIYEFDNNSNNIIFNIYNNSITSKKCCHYLEKQIIIDEQKLSFCIKYYTYCNKCDKSFNNVNNNYVYNECYVSSMEHCNHCCKFYDEKTTYHIHHKDVLYECNKNNEILCDICYKIYNKNLVHIHHNNHQFEYDKNTEKFCFTCSKIYNKKNVHYHIDNKTIEYDKKLSAFCKKCTKIYDINIIHYHTTNDNIIEYDKKTETMCHLCKKIHNKKNAHYHLKNRVIEYNQYTSCICNTCCAIYDKNLYHCQLCHSEHDKTNYYYCKKCKKCYNTQSTLHCNTCCNEYDFSCISCPKCNLQTH